MSIHRTIHFLNFFSEWTSPRLREVPLDVLVDFFSKMHNGNLSAFAEVAQTLSVGLHLLNAQKLLLHADISIGIQSVINFAIKRDIKCI